MLNQNQGHPQIEWKITHSIVSPQEEMKSPFEGAEGDDPSVEKLTDRNSTTTLLIITFNKMFEVEKLIRPHLKELVPYSSARDEFSGDEGIFLDANENPYGNLNRYPDPCQSKLKKKISRLKNIGTGQIFLGNGSDEIIDLLFRIFCNPGTDKAMIFEPTFGMYEASAQINEVEMVKIQLNEAFQIDLGDPELVRQVQSVSTKLVFICSPNNPTGNLINPKEVEYLLSNFEGMVIIDEAYIDFSPFESWGSAIEDHPNLVVLQTLSKAWGLAGLRIGMAFANPQVIQYLNKVKPPYNVSSVNQQMALKRLKNKQQYQKQVGCILAERERVAEALANCEPVKKIFPSDANFILIEVTDAGKVYGELAKQDIIVRNRNKQIKNTLRVTIGSPEENNLLITAFENLTA